MTLKQIFSELEENYVIHESLHDGYLSIRIMSKDGKCFARFSQYFSNKETACLDSLSVCEDARKQGIGTYLQEVRERIGVALGCTTALLSVKLNTWMFDWYESRGYEYCFDDEDNHVFMKKNLV